jgi:hypothetical protein
MDTPMTLDRYRAQRELDKETIADLQVRLAAAERAKEVMAEVLGETSDRLSDAQARAERLAGALADQRHLWELVKPGLDMLEASSRIPFTVVLDPIGRIDAALSPEARPREPSGGAVDAGGG